MLYLGDLQRDRSERPRRATRVGVGRARTLVIALHALTLCSFLAVERAHAQGDADSMSAPQQAGIETDAEAELATAHTPRSRSSRHRILVFGGVAALFLLIAGAVGAHDQHKRQTR